MYPTYYVELPTPGGEITGALEVDPGEVVVWEVWGTSALFSQIYVGPKDHLCKFKPGMPISWRGLELYLNYN